MSADKGFVICREVHGFKYYMALGNTHLWQGLISNATVFDTENECADILSKFGYSPTEIYLIKHTANEHHSRTT